MQSDLLESIRVKGSSSRTEVQGDITVEREIKNCWTLKRRKKAVLKRGIPQKMPHKSSKFQCIKQLYIKHRMNAENRIQFRARCTPNLLLMESTYRVKGNPNQRN